MNKWIIWAIAGFIAAAALGLHDGIGYIPFVGNDITDITIPLLTLASGVVGAIHFYVLYLAHTRGRRLAAYFSIFSIALAVILPEVVGEPWVYYLPSMLVMVPLRIDYGWPALFVSVSMSWVAWGLLGLGIGYLLEKLFKLVAKATRR